MASTYATATASLLVEEMSSCLRGGLMTPEMARVWKDVADVFEVRAINLLGFECPISRTSDSADFGICCYRSRFPLLGGKQQVASLSRLRDRDPRWSRVVNLIERLNEPTCEMAKYITRLWFEFDMGTLRSGFASVPGIYAEFAYGGADALGDPMSTEAVRAYRDFLSIVFDDEYRESSFQLFADCCARLPKGGVISALGAHISRPKYGIRACVGNLTRDQLPSFYSSLGLGEWAIDAVESMPRVSGYADAHVSSFEVTDRVLPRLGIESYGWTQGGDFPIASWGRWLDAICELGICTSEIRNSIEHWVGEDSLSCPNDLFGGMLTRTISHMKFVFGPGASPQAKVYLQGSFSRVFRLPRGRELLMGRESAN